MDGDGIGAAAGFPVQVTGKFGPTDVPAPPVRVLALGFGPDAATVLARAAHPALAGRTFTSGPVVADGSIYTTCSIADLSADPGGASQRLHRARRLDAADADPTALPYGDDELSAVPAMMVLHHLPDAAAQDRAFAEFARVLRPGGRLRGTDSLDSPGLRRLHAGDILVPVDPLTPGERLAAAGFVDVEIAVLAFGVRSCAAVR